MTGKTISHYRIIEKVGEGGMGVVYKAEDTKLHRTIALKFLHPDVIRSRELRARFWNEAEAAAALIHPNICVVHEIDEADGESFIAMEYVDGQSLAERLQVGPLPIQEVIDISLQVAEGLRAAHEKGVVHRDIKPANIMVDLSGRVKLMDFGLAHFDAATKITRTGTVLGTPNYMSPEQVEGQRVDHRTDIWSLGVVLYEMAKGRTPFEGDSQRAVMYAIAQKEPDDLGGTKLDRIVKRALQKNVEQRYQQADELLVDLRTARDLETPGRAQPAAVDSQKARPRLLAALLILSLTAAGIMGWFLSRQSKIRWAKYEAVLEIMRLADNQQYAEALRLAEEAEPYIPNDPTLMELLPTFSRVVNIQTEPVGAEVFTKPYAAPDAEWQPIGVTPIVDLRMPRGSPQVRIQKAGFRNVSLAVIPRATIVLDRDEAIPEGMVRVQGGKQVRVYIADLTHLKADLSDFFLDQHEVTNGEYAEFVAAGGYQSPEFWKNDFVRAGNRLSWEDAMKLFLDETGRPGPATWSLGTYRDGQKDYPVSGVSWYEAAAYAEFAGKSLPTVYHWSSAATLGLADRMLPYSNFGDAGPSPAGEHPGMSGAGCYDMAGNLKEWCWNEIGPEAGSRAILGGAWSEPDYMFAASDAQNPFFRSRTFGFRCMKPVEGSSGIEKLRGRIEPVRRDYTKEEPVDDDMFRVLSSFYSYDPQPVNAQVEATDDRPAYWRKETVSFDAAYGGERIKAYVFLPKQTAPPYQPIVLYPGSSALRIRSSAALTNFDSVEFIVRSGRAVIYPIYRSTYERGDGFVDVRPAASSSYRDHVIQWFKDSARAVDYLETRDDIDIGRLGYCGLSWGATLGPIILGLDDRYRAGVFVVGGFWQQKAAPEVEQLNYAPRVSAPVLMMNGRYDAIFPVQASQAPMFRMLGTSSEHKKHLIFESGHSIPRNERIRHTLDWFDRHLGPVE